MEGLLLRCTHIASLSRCWEPCSPCLSLCEISSSLSFSLYLFVCLSVFMSFSLSLFPPLSFSHFICLSLPLSLSLSLSIYIYIYIYIYISLSPSLPLSVCVALKWPQFEHKSLMVKDEANRQPHLPLSFSHVGFCWQQPSLSICSMGEQRRPSSLLISSTREHRRSPTKSTDMDQ